MNKTNNIQVDIAVIGGGSGGLSLASAASQMGAKVALIERAKMGGDCLNYGCIPSKSLLAAGHKAQIDKSKEFGISLEKKINFPKVIKHVSDVIKSIAPHDSVERFTSLGVEVIEEEASFISPYEIKAGKKKIRAKYFVIATGSSPFIPPIEGLKEVSYFTNETIFQNKVQPNHLVVIGGGPIGIEMAQAHAELGSKVSIVELFTILPREDEKIRSLIREKLEKLDIEIYENIKGIDKINQTKKTKEISLSIAMKTGRQKEIKCSHLLVATGRKANVSSLNLEKAKIQYDRKGIPTDRRLRTSQKHIFAIGDCTSLYQFTHIASYHASIVIQNILFRMPVRVKYNAIPWVTYTNPEIAHVGMTIAECEEKYKGKYITLSVPFAENDRARAEREDSGFAQAYVTKKGKILGVDIVGAKAGELIQIWCLAIQEGLHIKALVQYIVPYPTLGEINKALASSFYTPILFSPYVKKIVRFLLSLKTLRLK